jgi:hypothetical protein
MLNRIIELSLRHGLLVVLLAIGVVVAGAIVFRRLRRWRVRSSRRPSSACGPCS